MNRADLVAILARGGRHPRTGRAITISSARVPRFRPSRALKAAVR